MPAKARRTTSSSRSGGSRTGAKKSGGKRAASKTSGATKTLNKTAVKVMAGAAAGAVRAMIPPLEEAAGPARERRGSSKSLLARARSPGGAGSPASEISH
jgi:hypothetical protein